MKLPGEHLRWVEKKLAKGTVYVKAVLFAVLILSALPVRVDRRNSPSLEMKPWRTQKNSGQVEGWNQILDKVATVVAGLAQAK
jgi:hypothetical protein